MKKIDQVDEQLISRFVDAELSGAQRVEFERRLLREPELRAAVARQREACAWFAASRAGEPALHIEPKDSKAFVAAVLGAVQQQPLRVQVQDGPELGELEQEVVGALHVGRLMLAAAVLVLGVALLVGGGLLRPSRQDQLEAADVQRLREIDSGIVQAIEAGSDGSQPR